MRAEVATLAETAREGHAKLAQARQFFADEQFDLAFAMLEEAQVIGCRI